MKSIKEYIEDIHSDPIKLKTLFTVIWAAAYSMLVLGAFIIIQLLLHG